MLKVLNREWVESNSPAFSTLLQQGYWVVPKSAKKVRGVRWIQMQKLIEVESK